MPKVKLYHDVEGDAAVGDEVSVDPDRAEFLVVNGHATYVNKSDAKHLPPVGGQRPKGRTVGVEGTTRTSKIQTAREEKESAPAAEGEQKAPPEDDTEPDEEGAQVER